MGGVVWLVVSVLCLLALESRGCSLETCNDLRNCNEKNIDNLGLFRDICLSGGTEKAWSGKYWKEQRTHEDGVFYCSCCGHPLFPLSSKFPSGTGWPSFWAPFNDNSVLYREDFYSLEVECAKCGIHLGHVFSDGPAPSFKRYCINSICLHFKEGYLPNGTLSKHYFDRISKSSISAREFVLISGILLLLLLLAFLAFVMIKKQRRKQNQWQEIQQSEEAFQAIEYEVIEDLLAAPPSYHEDSLSVDPEGSQECLSEFGSDLDSSQLIDNSADISDEVESASETASDRGPQTPLATPIHQRDFH